MEDPMERAAYKKMLDAHEKAHSDYKFQLHLKQVNEQIPEAAGNYFAHAYPENDRHEIEESVKHSVKSKIRQEEVLKFFK